MKSWLIMQCVGLKAIGLVLIFPADCPLLGWLVFLSGGLLVVANLLFPRTQGLCDVVTGFESEGKEVWLTIDDSPDPVDTPKVLDLLDAHSAKATFFMIGLQAARYPDLVRMVLERGHTVGSHTHTHPVSDFWFAGPKRTKRELDMSLAALKSAGAEVRLFRSPVGIKNFFLKKALRTRGLHCVAWSIRSGDSFSHDADTAVNRVTREIRPGAIILMHEGNKVPEAVRVVAIGKVLKMLTKCGYRCVLPPIEAMCP